MDQLRDLDVVNADEDAAGVIEGLARPGQAATDKRSACVLFLPIDKGSKLAHLAASQTGGEQWPI